MKHSNPSSLNRKNTRPGFSSLLVVISVGIGLLLILVSMYENTVEAQAVEKKILLKNDYQQREDAFLRALTTIIPNKAMICMQDNSSNSAENLTWEAIMQEALAVSNSNSAVTPVVSAELGLDSKRTANVTNSELAADKVITPLAKVAYVDGTQQIIPGHWTTVTTSNWIEGYTIPGDWVEGTTSPPVWVPGHYKRVWWWQVWVEGYWEPGETTPGYWTEPTVVDGRWEETTEDQWVEPQVIASSDPEVEGNLVVSGTNRLATRNFPPPLECTSAVHVADSLYPVISYEKKYGDSATGWVSDNVQDHPQFNRVLAPNLHFKYQSNNRLIAKHNWWGFELGHSRNDQSKTGLHTRTKKYLISLYEVPSQLAINAASYTTLGQHADGTAWAHITSTGGIFAERIKTEGSFSADSLSSRKGVNLSDDSNIGGTTGTLAGSDPFASNARQSAESKGETFPISSAADGGRVAFIPINRGLDFYDRYTAANHSPTGINSISPTSWDYYSIGAQQCTMNLDVIDVASSGDQTPTAIRFTYSVDGVSTSEEFVKGSSWPAPESTDGQLFPFHTKTTSDNRPAIAFYAGRLKAFLATRGADQYTVNNTLSINVDYLGNGSIRTPLFPAANDDIAILLLESGDFSAYTKGFSLVTNLRLIIADDTNITPAPKPANVTLAAGEPYFPPLSMFAPEKRYGDSGSPIPVEIKGQLGSMAKGNNTPTRIADFKSGPNDAVIPANIRADLNPITNPAALPPITMMNWMVVVREIHPYRQQPSADPTTAATP